MILGSWRVHCVAILSSKFSSEATRGPNCSQKGHLGIPGWSGIGRVILGYLRTGQFPSFSSSSWSQAFFSGNFRQMFLGEAFWSLLHRWPDPRRRKINAKPWRVVQNQGFTKVTKVCFLIQIVSKVCVISGDFGWPFLTWARLFKENASQRKQPLFYHFLGRFRGWAF